MKKLLSIVLAVVMMASMVVSVAAAEHKQLVVGPASNDESLATVKTEGNAVVVDVKKEWNKDTDAAGGVALSPAITNFDMTNMGYVHIDIKSEVPFRIALLDRAGGDVKDKWITFTNEFFNSIEPKDKASDETPGTMEDLVDGKFFPAGEYQCVAFLGGVYSWKTNNGEAGWDIKKTNITGIYVEGQKPGKITINQLTLSDATAFEAQSGAPADAPSGGDQGGTTGGDSNTNTPTTTKAPAATTTTVKKAANTTGDSAKTGDVSNAIVFVVVAAAAAGVVTMSAVSKKSKAR